MPLASSFMFDSIGITSSLVDGANEEVESPENPSGPSLFRFVMCKATDKVCHKNKVETDKPKMMPMACLFLLMMWTWDGQ